MKKLAWLIGRTPNNATARAPDNDDDDDDVVCWFGSAVVCGVVGSVHAMRCDAMSIFINGGRLMMLCFRLGLMAAAAAAAAERVSVAGSESSVVGSFFLPFRTTVHTGAPCALAPSQRF